MTVGELRKALSTMPDNAILPTRPMSEKGAGRRIVGTVARMGGVMSVPDDFAWSWHQMVLYNNEYIETGEASIWYDRAIISHHATARNMLVKSMQGDWILMFDTDHAFEPDIVARMLHLLESVPEIDVLSAVYHQKLPPYYPNVFWWDGRNYNQVEALPDVELWGGEEFAAGAGTLLIRRRTLNLITEKLGQYPFDEVSEYKESNYTRQFTEDLSFFYRCRELRLKGFVAPRIESHHLRLHRTSSKDNLAAPITQPVAV